MNNYRKRIRADLTNTPKSDEGIPFSNRMDKARSIKKLKQALPITPNKRAAVLSAYVDCNRILKSPGVKKFHDSFEESVEKMAIRNIQDAITSVKHKRNGEAKAALNILTSSVSGENISDRKRATKSLANILGVNSRTLQKGEKKNRTKVLHSEHSSFLSTTWKTRSDALTEQTKRIVHDFWLQSNVSRPTNNKNDIKRVRISPNVYSSHSCYILEKTQTEVFLQFKNEYPDEKMRQSGVCKFSMLPGELDESDVQISWERYEYKNVKVKGDKTIRKLVLVRKVLPLLKCFNT
ncbi:unnamed protein product [Mytilus coruscus]|uniref:Uncharacterized protein n=1 Tax=Mytilus coruscus TaxID=42192 RepID=A0A6J8EPI6_MYTCO|nr:unnamed protein product [Mytilus coruscus]